MLHSWCNEAVTVKRAPLVERRGSTVRDWDNASSHCVSGCSVQPASTASNKDGRAEQVTDRYELLAPPCSDVEAGDRIVFGGRVFEIDGAPYEWKSPTGRVAHLHAHLVEWRG